MLVAGLAFGWAVLLVLLVVEGSASSVGSFSLGVIRVVVASLVVPLPFLLIRL